MAKPVPTVMLAVASLVSLHQIAYCRAVCCIGTSVVCLQPAEQLLRKGVNNPETSDNLRVRADFLEGADYVSIDVRVLGRPT